VGAGRVFAGKQARTATMAIAIAVLPYVRHLAAAEIDTGPGGEAEITLPAVEIVATPLPGGGIDRDKVPAGVQTLTAEDFARNPIASVTNTLFQGIPGVSLSDPNGNDVAQELTYRGFTASPLQGTPQGVAVYMNGIRLNEAFGDTVNWDLIPTNAIERADVWTNNPVFGLNALGGAVNLQTKNGFIYSGRQGELRGGSFGRIAGEAQYGERFGDKAVYLAAQGLHDGGWRFRSPADVGRFVADFGWRDERAELHLFGAAAATPIDLLNRDDRAVYTTPQTTRNSMALAALNGKFSLTDAVQLQGNLYVRGFSQNHVDGNPADVEQCSSRASPQFQGRLCLQDDGFPRPNPVTASFRDQFAILDRNNASIPCPSGTGCNDVPYGTIDRTATKATTTGLSLQATDTGKLFGHGNHFLVGGSIDHGSATFTSGSELGYIYPDLVVATNPAIPGTGSQIHTLGGFGYGPVGINTRNDYYGLYALNTVDVTERLSATTGGRLNFAAIGLSDQLGTSPDLNGDHTFTRLNPVAGLTYRLGSSLIAFAGYSEANRAPTPVELACADPVRPCLLENSLVADPPLKQVVARTLEVGLRDRLRLDEARLEWQTALFRTNATDDIISVASAIQGRGYFQNVPGTRRQGVEANLRYQAGPWRTYAGFSFLDATYQFTGDLPSPNNPMADAAGNVHVVPGKQIPGLPQYQAKMGVEYRPAPRWTLGADLFVVGSRFFIGDDANQNPKLPGYWLVNLNASYQVTEEVQIFGLVNNLFDKRYALFGTYFDPKAVENVGLPIVLTDRRTEVFGPPLAIYGGVRVIF
jgi:iron complex outermembrane receptor protein